MITIADIPAPSVRYAITQRLSKWLGRDAEVDELLPIRLLVSLCAEPVSASYVIMAHPDGTAILDEAQRLLECDVGAIPAQTIIRSVFEDWPGSELHHTILLSTLDAAVTAILGPDKTVRQK